MRQPTRGCRLLRTGSTWRVAARRSAMLQRAALCKECVQRGGGLWYAYKLCCSPHAGAGSWAPVQCSAVRCCAAPFKECVQRGGGLWFAYKIRCMRMQVVGHLINAARCGAALRCAVQCKVHAHRGAVVCLTSRAASNMHKMHLESLACPRKESRSVSVASRSNMCSFLSFHS